MALDKEITAISAIASALDQFTEDERETLERIVRWTNSRYSVSAEAARSVIVKSEGAPDVPLEGPSGNFADIADLFAEAHPRTAAERALVAGYWLTTGEGMVEFGSQDANRHLKNLGHGVSNITDALSALKMRKPSLVMQTAKSGKSKQARKKYKLTRAGLDAVVVMIRNSASVEE